MMKQYFELFFDQIPKGTAQMKRYDGRSHRFFKSKALEETEDTYMNALAWHRPPKPSEFPIRLQVKFFYSTKDKKKFGKPKTSRPDCDNVAKLLIDCMTKSGFWIDDAQIHDIEVSKFWTNGQAMICVRYEEVVP